MLVLSGDMTWMTMTSKRLQSNLVIISNITQKLAEVKAEEPGTMITNIPIGKNLEPCLKKIGPLHIFFSSNHNIQKSSYGHCFWGSYPLLIDFTWIYQLKVWSSKTKVTQSFMNVVIWRKEYIFKYKYFSFSLL